MMNSLVFAGVRITIRDLYLTKKYTEISKMSQGRKSFRNGCSILSIAPFPSE
jgi:hypothetical protein